MLLFHLTHLQYAAVIFDSKAIGVVSQGIYDAQFSETNLFTAMDLVETLCGQLDLHASYPQVQPTIAAYLALLERPDPSISERALKFINKIANRFPASLESIFAVDIAAMCVNKIRSRQPEVVKSALELSSTLLKIGLRSQKQKFTKAGLLDALISTVSNGGAASFVSCCVV